MKKKSTNWQLNFFIAIMTSWTVFNIFYVKQFNKKMFDQYLGRFFRTIKNENFQKQSIKSKKESTIQYNTFIPSITALISFLKRTKVSSPCEKFDLTISFEKKTLLLAIRNVLNMRHELFSSTSFDCNNIMRMYFINIDTITLAGLYSANDILRHLHNNISVRAANVDHITLNKITLNDSRRGYELVHNVVIEILKFYIKSFNGKNISKIERMNIGLEFEYDKENYETIPQSNLLSFDSPYITEISSGYDGTSYDKDEILASKFTKILKAREKESTRLNEDRLRLNHFKGLEILEKYLSYLNKNGKISKSSSVHIHIDCKYDESYKNITYSKKDSVLFKYFKRVRHPSLTDIIYLRREEKSFNKKGYLELSNESITNMISESIHKNELETLEFRSFKTSFLYEDIVMYILIASYIANAIKKNTKINDKLIKTIIKANSIVKSRKCKTNK